MDKLKTVAEAISKLFDEYHKGNVSKVGMSFDVELVNDKLAKLQQSHAELKVKLDKIKTAVKNLGDAAVEMYPSDISEWADKTLAEIGEV